MVEITSIFAVSNSFLSVFIESLLESDLNKKLSSSPPVWVLEVCSNGFYVWILLFNSYLGPASEELSLIPKPASLSVYFAALEDSVWFPIRAYSS